MGECKAMSDVVKCKHCQREVVWLQLYNGTTRPFNAQQRSPTQRTEAEQWYAIAGRGMVPRTLLSDMSVGDRPYLTQHICLSVLSGWDGKYEKFEISRTEGTRVPDLVLGPEHEYTYRWPSSWAHILERFPYQAICGARMPEGKRTRERERDRLRNMPVCPNCETRYRRWADRQETEE